MNHSYTAIAKLFHWGMALVFAGLIALGFVMTDMPLSPEKLQYYSWHKWAGVTVFVLVWLRLAWRVLNPPPAYGHDKSKPIAEVYTFNTTQLARARLGRFCDIPLTCQPTLCVPLLY